MKEDIEITSIFKPSENIISKNIEGISMLVPIVSGVGNLDSELFQLNETGTRVWDMLDGKTSLEQIITVLCQEYEAPYETIEQDVVELVQGLMAKNFILRIS